MKKEVDVFSKLIIQGFTINPVVDKQEFKNIINGLCNSYVDFHICDYGIDPVVHKNDLGKLLFKDFFIQYLDPLEKEGLIAFVALDNGYFTIKIKYNVYPAEIFFDLFIDKKITDINIIVDHLSAPAIKNDGLGMFDYTYNLSYIVKNKSILQKHNKDIISDKIFINNFKNSEGDQISLNSLNSIECYFCENVASTTLFFDEPSKVVLSCNDHKQMGRVKEIGDGAKKDNETDNRDIGKILKNTYKMQITEIDGVKYGKNVK